MGSINSLNVIDIFCFGNNVIFLGNIFFTLGAIISIGPPVAVPSTAHAQNDKTTKIRNI